MESAVIYFDDYTKKVVRTDPPELKQHIVQIEGTDVWIVPVLQNFYTGQLFNYRLEKVAGGCNDATAL